jgi:SNF2 family DNA or RNA helicase
MTEARPSASTIVNWGARVRLAALTSTSGGSRAGEPSLSNVFGQLRKLCNHPSLLEKADAKLPTLGNKAAVAAALDALVGASGKMQLLHKLVTRLREEGRKVLIFSQVRVPPDCPLSAL